MIASSAMIMTILISFWMLIHSMNNFVGYAFKKQAATATATADEFDAFLSLSELCSSLSQLFLKHCDNIYSQRVIETSIFGLF
jgi:hypothetical protein